MQFDFSLKWLTNLDLKEVPPEVLCAIESAVAQEKRRRLNGSRGANLYRRREIDREKLFRDYGKSIVKTPEQDAVEAAMVAYFESIMGEDWSSHFDAPGEAGYYVYLHFDPRADRRISLSHGDCSIDLAGEPFYVGKGVGLRAYDLKRNDGHGAILRQLRADGFMAEDVVKIVARDLSEARALEIESKLIHFFGSRYDSGNAGSLVNLAQTPGPVLRPRRPKVLA